MEDAPFGTRDESEAEIFRTQTSDLGIVPDRVSPPVEGYFRIPAIWVGDEPTSSSVNFLNPTIHHYCAIKKRLNCGILVYVQRDGTFLFDFSKWLPAPIVLIPGYRISDPSKPHRPLPAHSKAEDLAQSFAVLRAQVMNAHQACLTTSEFQVKRRGAAMGFPVNAWNTIKSLKWNAQHPYYDDTEDIHALARNVLNNKDHISRQHPLQRRSIELEVIEHSLALLDHLLKDDDVVLVQIVEAAYLAACRNQEKRFGEAIVVGWGVCEQLIIAAWNKMLDERQLHNIETFGMPKHRREKLNGRDYSASVMVEMLEVNGQLDRELYRKLEIARKARNNWVHQMRAPKESESDICILAAVQLLKLVKSIYLSLQASGRGGVPQWPIWMWESKSKHS